MSDQNPEKAIIIGCSGETFFVATSNNELIMRKNERNRQFQMGDCINVLSTSQTMWRDPNGVFATKIVVENFEKIGPFVEWRLQNNKHGILVMSDILDVRMRRHPNSNKLVRCFRTSFLEEVYDSDVSKTDMYTEREVMKMKVVAVHLVSTGKRGFWAVLNMNVDPNTIDPSNGLFGNNGRIQQKGIVLEGSERRSKNGSDGMYLWVPFRREPIWFPEELRGNIPKQRFLGNWVEFTVNTSYRMDQNSNVHLIQDVLPTRFFHNRYEVKVDIIFESDCWDGKGYPEILSTHCGKIADVSDTLRTYNRLKSFSGEAWVHYFPHEPSRGIKFVLSEKQEHWNREPENDRHPQYDMFGSETSRDSYDENKYQSGYGRRERSRSPARNYGGGGNSTDFKYFSRRDNPEFEENHRRERSRPPREDEEFYNHQRNRDDLRRSRSVTRKPMEPREKQDHSSPENDSDDSWDQEAERRSRMRQSSKPPMRNENERSPQRPNYRDTFDYKNSEREEDYGRRERSRPREDFDIVDERNREYERRSRLRESSRPPMKNEREKSRPPSRVDRSPSRKRDDTSSIPSTSRSYDNLGKAQTNLKKLKTRYEYLTANSMPIPESLREDLKNAILEEQNSRKTNFDQEDFDDYESRKSGSRGNSSRVEVDEEDLQKYKELVVMFREMLSSQEVCDEMRRFDEIAMDNINKLLFDL